MGFLTKLARRITHPPSRRDIMQHPKVRSYRRRATEEAAISQAEKYHKSEGKKEARLAYAHALREERVRQAKAKAKADAVRPSLARRIGTRLIEGPRQPRYAPRPTPPPRRASRRRYPPPSGFQLPQGSAERRRREERRKWGF